MSFKHLHKTGEQASHWKGGGIRHICPNCGNIFYSKIADSHRRKYCSKKCFDFARIKRTPIPCPTCGKMRELRDSDIKRGRFFCNTRCYRLHRPTSIELAIQNKLSELNIEFIPEYKVGHWSIDFYIPSTKLAIECDGTYWHKRTKDINRDNRKDAFLNTKGINILRLSEEQIRNDLIGCVKLINSHV